MDIVDNIRCAVELILPALAWLAKVFAGKKGAAAETIKPEGAHVNGLQVQGEESASNELLATAPAAQGHLESEREEPNSRGMTVDSAAGGGAWAAYFEKQTSLQAAAPGIVAQPAMARIAGSRTGVTTAAGRSGVTRLLRDFGPGALGALIVTIAFVVVVAFSGPVVTPEDKATIQAFVFAEVLCMPFALVAGGLIGGLASLLTKALAKAVHMGERAQVATSAIVGGILGAVTGALCDVLALFGAAL